MIMELLVQFILCVVVYTTMGGTGVEATDAYVRGEVFLNNQLIGFSQLNGDLQTKLCKTVQAVFTAKITGSGPTCSDYAASGYFIKMKVSYTGSVVDESKIKELKAGLLDSYSTAQDKIFYAINVNVTAEDPGAEGPENPHKTVSDALRISGKVQKGTADVNYAEECKDEKACTAFGQQLCEQTLKAIKATPDGYEGLETKCALKSGKEAVVETSLDWPYYFSKGKILLDTDPTVHTQLAKAITAASKSQGEAHYIQGVEVKVTPAVEQKPGAAQKTSAQMVILCTSAAVAMFMLNRI